MRKPMLDEPAWVAVWGAIVGLWFGSTFSEAASDTVRLALTAAVMVGLAVRWLDRLAARLPDKEHD